MKSYERAVQRFQEFHQRRNAAPRTDISKAELTRRETFRGRASPRTTNRFTGLFLCGACGWHMSYARSPGYVALRCNSRYDSSPTRPDCNERSYLREAVAQAYIDARLREMLALEDAASFLVDTPPPADTAQQLAALRGQVTEVEQQIQRMILKQTSADSGLHDQYDQAIANAGERLKILRARLKALEQSHAAQPSAAAQQRAYHDITAITLDGFWALPDRDINQLLLRLLGNRRFVARGGVVVGTADAPVRRNRRY